MDHPMKDPEDVIEEFAIKMVLFSSIADGTDEGRIFSIAADFADECLTLSAADGQLHDLRLQQAKAEEAAGGYQEVACRDRNEDQR